jgi:predicted chitinase
VISETYNNFSELLNGVKDNAKKMLNKLSNGLILSNSEKKKFEELNKNAKTKLEIALKSFDLHYPNTKDGFQLRSRQQILKAISIIGNTTECMKSNNTQAEPMKKGPIWSSMPLADPCSDSLSELAEFDFQLLQDNVALTEEEGKFAKEILDVTKFTLDVKNKSKDNKPESLNLKPNFDLHLAKMQAIADRFTAPKPEVDSKRYQVENVNLKLNGKTTQLKHFILGYEGDFTINLNEFSEENITDNTKDKLLFVGAQASKKELLAVHGTKIDVKTVYDYLSPKKGKLTGKQLYDIFVDKNGKHITPLSRCVEVAKLIVKYADEYGLTSNERLAHFIGQIGAESNLSSLKEGALYSTKERIVKVFGKVENIEGNIKYCALYKGYDTEIDKCGNANEPSPCYPAIKIYNSKLEVKEKYLNSRNLFDYVYSCRNGNGPPKTGDGYRFRGRAFMHLTGKAKYETLESNWNKTFPDNKKDFTCDSDECESTRELLVTDLDFAMKSSLAFWSSVSANEEANKVTDSSIKKVSKAINGGYNGIDVRITLTNNAYNILKK